MTEVSDIIDIWPSMAELGRDLDLPYSTVAAWRQRGSIPAQHWLALIRAGRRRGHATLTSDLLTEAHGLASDPPRSGGLAESDLPPADRAPRTAAEGNGQFSRWKAVRRPHFASMDEIVDHVRALRDEWERR